MAWLTDKSEYSGARLSILAIEKQEASQNVALLRGAAAGAYDKPELELD